MRLQWYIRYLRRAFPSPVPTWDLRVQRKSRYERQEPAAQLVKQVCQPYLMRPLARFQPTGPALRGPMLQLPMCMLNCAPLDKRQEPVPRVGEFIW